MLALAEALDDMGEDIAEDVCEVARVECRKVPSVSELYVIARRIRAEEHEREEQGRRASMLALARPEGVPMPEWVREKYVRMVQSLNPVAAIREAEEESKQRTEEISRALRMAGAVRRMSGTCNGSGKAVEIRDGKRVCPDCGVEIPDIEVRVPKPTGTHKPWRKDLRTA